MFGRIAIRNIPADIWSALEDLARQHDRSTEAEARFALRSWVAPNVQLNERNARRNEVSTRLRALLDAVNSARRGPVIKPSHIAQAIGESHAEHVEDWFTGEKEPSFTQLAAVAEFLGGVTAWLQHGDRAMFPVRHDRLPEEVNEAFRWLFNVDAGEPVERLHFVREMSKTGCLAIVKQFDDYRCETIFTTIHVSEEIGAGGEGSLARLFITLELLYTLYTEISGIRIAGQLVPKEQFDLIIQGNLHPLAAISNGPGVPWWEDIWDEKAKQHSGYWEGWSSLVARILNVVKSRGVYGDLLDQIRSKRHPLIVELRERGYPLKQATRAKSYAP